MARCWIWTEPEERCLSAIKQHITEESGTSDILVLKFESATGHLKDDTNIVTKFLLSHAREKGNVLPNFYATFLNSRDCLAALQLSLAQIHKQNKDKFIAPSAQVRKLYDLYISGDFNLQDQQSLFSKAIAEYMRFCEHSNSVDQWQLCKLIADKEPLVCPENRHFLLLGQPDPQEFLGAVLGVLQPDSAQVRRLHVELPLDPGLAEEELRATSSVLDHWRSLPCPSATQPLTSTPSRLYVQEVALASLQLMVNSRSELAPARLMGSPLLAAEHPAFTALKQAAAAARLPLCQAATSYVIKKRLGGKGYQAKEENPLNLHLPALEAFTDYFDDLQTIREDVLNTGEATNKILLRIRRRLIRNSADGKLSHEEIDEVFNELKEAALFLDENQVYNETEVKAKTTGYGHKTLLLLRELADLLSCSLPCPPPDERFLTPLPFGHPKTSADSQLPTIFSLFRSPEVLPSSSSAKVQKSRLKQPDVPPQPGSESAPPPRSWEVLPFSSPVKVQHSRSKQPEITQVPSPRPVSEKENSAPPPILKREAPKSARPPPPKKLRRKLNLDGKPRGKKPFVMIQGQVPITSFFKK